MKPKAYQVAGLLGMAALLGLGFFLYLRRGVNQARSAARSERNSRSDSAPLVYEGEWRAAASDTDRHGAAARALTRLLPVNDLAPWAGRQVLATDGGLVIKEPGRPLVLTAVDGLPGTRISALAVFHDLLIAGTDDGIAQLDLKNLRSYRFSNPRANRVTALLVRPDSVIIGTQGGGVLQYSAAGFGVYPLLRDRPDLKVSALAWFEDALAIGAWESGLLIFQNGKLVTLGEREGLDPPVIALWPQGTRLLIGTPLALQAYSSPRGVETILPSVSIGSVVAAGDEIIASDLERGLLHIREGRVRREAQDQFIKKLAWSGRELFAVGEGGVMRMGPEGLEPPDSSGTMDSGPLPENRLVAAARAPDGRLWLGTFEHGVALLNPDLSLAAQKSEPGYAAVNCIRADAKRNRVYVGTSRGLLVYSGSNLVSRLTPENGLIGEAVQDVLPLADGSLAIATNRGITFQTAKGLRSIYAFHGLANNHVYCLAAFGDQLAAGTLGGLSLLKGERVVRNYTMDNSPLRHNWISALAADPDHLFIGTFGGGVMSRSRNGEWDPLAGPLDHADINQNALLIAAGRLWAGTFGAGLLDLDLASGEWNNYRVGLTSRNVTGLAAMSDRTIAVATDAGLTVIEVK